MAKLSRAQIRSQHELLIRLPRLLRGVDGDLGSSLAPVIDGLRAAAGVDAVLLRLRRGPWLEMVAVSGLPLRVLGKLRRVLLGQESLAARAASKGIIARSAGALGNGASAPDPEPPGFRSQLVVPLGVGDAVLGVLDLRAERPNAFGFDDVAFAETVAAQVGLTVRASQLEARLDGGSSPERVCLDSLISVTRALEQGDRYYAGHAERVAWISNELALAAGLDGDERHRLETAARLHDVGMMGIPDTVLSKPDELDREEETLVEMHPLVGERLCRLLPDGEQIGAWVMSHHERWDGTGYPEGLRAQEIPFGARLIAVADAYDALTSDRPFRTALGFSDALDVLRDESGRFFDPSVVTFAIDLAPTLERTLSERSRFLLGPDESDDGDTEPIERPVID